jgi:hypothetical protein
MPRHLTTRQEVIIAKSLRGYELDSRQSLFGWLLFQGQRRAANFFFLEVEGYLVPLPISTLSAWILTLRAPVVASADAKVKAASHLSNLPTIATEALT